MVLEVNFLLFKKKGPMGVVVVMAIGAEMAAAMAIFSNAFNSDNFQVF